MNVQRLATRSARKTTRLPAATLAGSLLVSLVGLVNLTACAGPTVDHHQSSFVFDSDAGTATQSQTIEVTLDPIAQETPYPVATLRGQATGARRVLVYGAENPSSVAVLPDGSFCIDIGLPSPMGYEFQVFAQATDGTISSLPAVATTTYSDVFPDLPTATTCSGGSQAGCAGATEICGNGRDDDCNGQIDDNDRACLTCTDDVLEPNDEPEAPRIEPGRHDLVMCGTNHDYFRIYARSGQTMASHLYFDTLNNDLQLQLLHAKTEADQTTTYEVLSESLSNTDDESVRYVVPDGGTGDYILHVWSTTDNDSSYTLNVQLDP